MSRRDHESETQSIRNQNQIGDQEPFQNDSQEYQEQEERKQSIQEQEDENEITQNNMQRMQDRQPINIDKIKSVSSKEELLWKAYDFLFPGGRTAKLIKVTDVNAKNIPFNDMLFKLKMMEGSPVINLIGAKDTSRGKFYGGIARAAFNTDAVIIDNAITTGIEKYVIRRGLKLLGVAPENEIKYPKQQGYGDPYEISNGHTLLFLLNNKDKNMFWGMESSFKINLCKKIAEGRMTKTGGRESCKILHILFGESDSFMSELQLAVLNNQPILVVRGSELCNEYFANQSRLNQVYSEPSFGPLVRQGQFFGLNSLDSEDVAQYVHFLLTVTPQRLEKIR